jgi:outer membrane receptor protein involved in Fe transport
VAPTPWKAAVALPVAGFPTTAVSDAKQLGVFIQDDWEVNDKLTLNLGVRWDIEENPSYHDNVTPQFVLDAFNTVNPNTGLTYAQQLAQSEDPNVRVDVNDYISTGNNREPYKNAFQPRLGFSYDFGGDQQHVLFGGAGRAYDRTLYDFLQLEQTKFALATAEVRFNSVDHPCTISGTDCVAWDPAFASDPATLVALFAGRPGEINLINNDLRIPYSDQISLGMRNRVGDWNTSAAISRVESNDGFVFTLGNRHESGEFFDPITRAQPWGNSPPGLGSLIIGNSGIKTKSTQVLLSAEKPFDEASKWGTTVAYTFTRARQNRDIKEHYLFDAPSINAFPYIKSNAAPKHRLVTTGTYAGPWGLRFAGKFTYATATPRNVISCLPTGTFPGGGACSPFSYTLGASDGYRSLDLQMTKNFEVGDLGSMYVRLDVLNVTNEENLVDYRDEVFDGNSVTGRMNPNGNITGFTRTLRASFGVKF